MWIRSQAGRVARGLRGRWDKYRVGARYDFLRGAEPRLALIADELRADYESYVGNVSTADMAVSLETACLLRLLCEGLKPQRVLDLGSGFSSFTLRSYQPARGRPAICSVDDSPEWLQRTREYLDEQGLPTDDLWTWSDFHASDQAPFDLVFYDLGRMHLRRKALRQALSLGRGGIVLLDDMHKYEYAQETYSILAGLGCTWFDLRALTLDERGRFSVLVTDIRSGEDIDVIPTEQGHSPSPTTTRREGSKQTP